MVKIAEQVPLELRLGNFQIDKNRIYDRSKPHKYIVEKKENQALIHVSNAEFHKEIAEKAGVKTGSAVRFTDDERERVIGAGTIFVGYTTLLIDGSSRRYSPPARELIENFVPILLEKFRKHGIGATIGKVSDYL